MALGVGDALVRQDLNCSEPLEMSILGFVDNSHAAAAQFGQETVMGNRLAYHTASGSLGANERGFRSVYRTGGSQRESDAFGCLTPSEGRGYIGCGKTISWTARGRRKPKMGKPSRVINRNGSHGKATVNCA